MHFERVEPGGVQPERVSPLDAAILVGMVELVDVKCLQVHRVVGGADAVYD